MQASKLLQITVYASEPIVFIKLRFPLYRFQDFSFPVVYIRRGLYIFIGTTVVTSGRGAMSTQIDKQKHGKPKCVPVDDAGAFVSHHPLSIPGSCGFCSTPVQIWFGKLPAAESDPE